MDSETRLDNNIFIIKLRGELMGGAEVNKFRKIIDEAIASEHVNVVIDMSNVTWMNSSGLGMLVSALTSLRSSGGDMKLAALTERLRRPLQITKLDSVFEEFSTIETAINSY